MWLLTTSLLWTLAIPVTFLYILNVITYFLNVFIIKTLE